MSHFNISLKQTCYPTVCLCRFYDAGETRGGRLDEKNAEKCPVRGSRPGRCRFRTGHRMCHKRRDVDYRNAHMQRTPSPVRCRDCYLAVNPRQARYLAARTFPSWRCRYLMASGRVHFHHGAFRLAVIRYRTAADARL